MAGGPYKGSGGWYHIKWSNKRSHPEEPKKTESLKTNKKKIAVRRMSKLEDLYDKNKHDPWVIPWHENDQIRPLIVGNMFDEDVSIEDIEPPEENYVPTMLEAVEEYISYKDPEGDTKTEEHQWSPQTNAPKMKAQLRHFAKVVGSKKMSAVTKEDYKKVIQEKDLNSDHSVANVAIKWNAFVNYCEEKKWISKAPTINVPKPQANIPVFIYNDDLYKICRYKIDKVKQEIETGYTQPNNSQLYMPLGWLLIRFTGMRPIELQKLYLDAIDIPHRQITVGKKYDKNTNRTKTAIQRNIEMNAVVREICKLVKDPAFRAGDRWMKKSDHIFGRSGNMSKKRLSSEFTEARKEILPHRDEVTLYTLRDTFAVAQLSDPNMSQNPIQAMYNIKKAMGHKSLETTEKYWKAVPPRFHHQRLHNSKIFGKILREFHQSSISNQKAG